MKTLEQQIEELTAKHNLETTVKGMFPDLKVITFASTDKHYGSKYYVSIDLKSTSYGEERLTREQVQERVIEIVKTCPTTETTNRVYKNSGDEITASPFVLNFNNGVNDQYCSIEYVSGEFNIHIKVPISYFDDDLIYHSMRGITDSEYHYFTARSRKELAEIRIRVADLRGFKEVKYYGGSIKKYITEPDYREEFDTIVLTGKSL